MFGRLRVIIMAKETDGRYASGILVGSLMIQRKQGQQLWIKIFFYQANVLMNK